MTDEVKEYLAKNGAKGGVITRERNGKDYYKELNKKSVEARRAKKASLAAVDKSIQPNV